MNKDIKNIITNYVNKSKPYVYELNILLQELKNDIEQINNKDYIYFENEYYKIKYFSYKSNSKYIFQLATI